MQLTTVWLPEINPEMFKEERVGTIQDGISWLKTVATPQSSLRSATGRSRNDLQESGRLGQHRSYTEGRKRKSHPTQK